MTASVGIRMLVRIGMAVAWSVFGTAQAWPASRPVADEVVVDLTKPVNTIVPNDAIVTAIDGMGRGEIDRYLTPLNIEKMRSAGVRRVTYRTRPELGIEAWHWSEEGSWSDGAKRQGYWTSSDNPASEPRVTWGYSLPRRGNSVDQANDLGYSRLDDGDPDSFWKSNPYLDRRYTRAPESRPQWIVVSLRAATPVEAARILWGAPFARRFKVQFWQGKDEFDRSGHWATFPQGDRTLSDSPTNTVFRLADAPMAVRFLRILLLDSSETAPPGSSDIRDRVGYAIREIGFGALRANGELADAVRHGRSRDAQTLIQVSSTDPWHRAIDRDPDTEQPGLAFIFQSGLTGGLPMMVPAGVYYDTPENAAAELRYLRRRGYPVRQVELGEEPDGQFISPEDYADLYLQTARLLHAIDPDLSLGGPSMQGATTETWPDPEGGRSWSARFLAHLTERGGLDQLGFFSFEHYPFDDVCQPLGAMLRDETQLMDNAMAGLSGAGIPRSIPWIITEYGFSPFAGRAMSGVPSALLSADIVGQFLSLGGTTAHMFGYAPGVPANHIFPCAGYGGMMFHQADDRGRARWPIPMYHAARMMMQDWGNPPDKPHRLYGAHTKATDTKGRPFVTAYPLFSPDGSWAIMLINRNERRAHRIRILFDRGGTVASPFGTGQRLQVVQYSPANYAWVERGDDSHPVRDQPPARYATEGKPEILLPAFSLTIIRGSGPLP